LSRIAALLKNVSTSRAVYGGSQHWQRRDGQIIGSEWDGDSFAHAPLEFLSPTAYAAQPRTVGALAA
jgi:hypothetical protein